MHSFGVARNKCSGTTENVQLQLTIVNEICLLFVVSLQRYD